MVNPEILTANLVNSKQTIARQTGVIKNCIALNLQTSSHRGELKPQVTLRARRSRKRQTKPLHAVRW